MSDSASFVLPATPAPTSSSSESIRSAASTIKPAPVVPPRAKAAIRSSTSMNPQYSTGSIGTMPMSAFPVALSGLPATNQRENSLFAMIDIPKAKTDTLGTPLIFATAAAMVRVNNIIDLIDIAKSILAWKDASLSAIVLVVFLSCCVYPILVLVIPQVALSSYIFYRYISVAPPIPPKLPPQSNFAAVYEFIGTEKFNRNMQFTQNSMAYFCSTVDNLALLHEQYLTWRDPEKTKKLLKGTIAAIPICFVLGSAIPLWFLRVSVATGGTWVLCSQTWLAIFLFDAVPKVLRRRGYEMVEQCIKNMPLPDSVVDFSGRFGWAVATNRPDSELNGKKVMVEVFENQRWWAGPGWSSTLLEDERASWSDIAGLAKLSEKAPDSAPPLLGHIWINDDWILDTNWAAVDESGWVYTWVEFLKYSRLTEMFFRDHNWTNPSKTPGITSLTRRRRWIRTMREIAVPLDERKSTLKTNSEKRRSIESCDTRIMSVVTNYSADMLDEDKKKRLSSWIARDSIGAASRPKTKQTPRRIFVTDSFDQEYPKMNANFNIEAALTQPIVTELANVVALLLSPNNNERQLAETSLNSQWKDSQPHILLAGLASLISSHPEPQIRSLSAVLLRRYASKVPVNDNDEDEAQTLWVLVPESVRQYTQAQLLQGLSQETAVDVRHKICDTISEIMIENMNADLDWPALLAAIQECLKGSAPHLREAGLRIISTVPSLITDKSSPAAAVPLFADCLGTPGSQEVRVTAIHASVMYMIDVLQTEDGDETASNTASNTPARNAFAQLMPVILTTLAGLTEEKLVVDSFSYLIDLAESDPRLFREHLPSLIDFVATVMRNEQLDSPTRQTAVELLIALAEARPGMIRKLPQFTSTIVPLLLGWMAKIEDSESWYTTDDLNSEDDDNDEDYVFAEQAIDRLSLALGGKSMLSIAFNLIPKLLISADWQSRHAGLLAISVMGEGCRDVMIDSLKEVVDLVIPYLGDPHPRVRFAACNCIGQMCTDFAPTFQSDYNDIILSNLVPLMDDSANPRVQSHAAAALVNFMEDADKHKITPALDEIVRRLVGLLNVEKTYVQEQAITTIATVADCAGKNFVNYYGSIMPVLINILQNATDKRFRLLRGKALECASLIGLAVEKEVFSQHVHQLLQILQAIQQEPKEDDDPVASYLLVAWARVCKVIGVDFVPYLSVVIPPLIASAAVKPDMAVLDSDESEDKYPEDEGWEFISLGNQKFGIKTNVLEDKHTAVEMICTYARDLEEHFVPYVQTVMETTVPLLNFVFHDGVRHAAASTIPLLFNCLKRAHVPNEQIFTYWNGVVEKLLDFMMTEMDPGYSSHIYSTYSECLQYLGADFLTQDQMERFIVSAEKQLDEFVKRTRERNASRKDVDYDEEEEETLRMDEESDSELLAEIANSVHEIFKIAGVAFLSFIEPILPKLKLFLTNSKDDTKHFGLCVFADVVEFCGPASFKYHTLFFEQFVQALSSKDADVRQAAAYSVGICASKGGADFASGCIAALGPLGSLILDSKAKSTDNIMATENAISAVGKICASYNGARGFDSNQALTYWFNSMPILNDQDEANVSYSYLLQLIESNHPAILGPNNSNFPKIVSVLCRALVSDLEFSPEVERKMILAVQAIRGAAPSINPAEDVAVERHHILQQKLG
ncbi:hypothetical protein HK100_000026 [Physocladia obscura]|uniref:Uncharacterized protein n=1 Tax=Physocladia obscura TaxID=109957 RepID=A0AAD5TAJ4_9FUNG|nr:hypothetical protein HK100_000026 [Physocladia obscura]